MEQNTSNQNIINDDVQENTQQDATSTSLAAKQESVSNDGKKIVEWICYIVGIIFVIIAFIYLGKDLDYEDNPFYFREKRYVGGDAYNFIISAARSSAIMVKSLVWMVAGCSSLIFGRITALMQNR